MLEVWVGLAGSIHLELQFNKFFASKPEQIVRYVTELSDYIKTKESKEDDDQSSEFVKFFPEFIWAIRDFTLELKIDDKDATDNEYLEFALNLKSGNKN